MFLIVGLGNPGKKYKNTRHNVGFMTLDEIAKENWEYSKKFKAEIQKIQLLRKEVILLKPRTFMNLSGEAVNSCANFFQIPTENIWVIYDDKDLDLGDIRIRDKGSSGGHKGMESIIKSLGTQDFARFRIGIKTAELDKIPTESFVLQEFSKEEKKAIKESIEKIIDLIKKSLEEGIINTSI